jgi:uncharacterized protein YbjT (DUF2867 family)
MILITGATGNIGRALVSELKGKGVRLRIGQHVNGGPAPAGVEAVPLDYTDGATLSAAVKGVEKVFLLSPAGERSAEHETNVVEAAAKAGVRHVVKSSIFPAVNDYTFGRSHRRVEDLIRTKRVAFTFVRPNSFMQSMANFFSGSIKGQGAFYLPAGKARISHVDIRDVAAVAAKALTEPGHEGHAYDLTGPEALSYDDVAAKLSAVAKKPVKYVDIDPQSFRSSMLGYGLPDWLVDGMIDYERFCGAGGAEKVTDTVTRLLGRKAIDFDTYARDNREAFA